LNIRRYFQPSQRPCFHRSDAHGLIRHPPHASMPSCEDISAIFGGEDTNRDNHELATNYLMRWNIRKYFFHNLQSCLHRSGPHNLAISHLMQLNTGTSTVIFIHDAHGAFTTWRVTYLKDCYTRRCSVLWLPRLHRSGPHGVISNCLMLHNHLAMAVRNLQRWLHIYVTVTNER
jgi:hypothetical protein